MFGKKNTDNDIDPKLFALQKENEILKKQLEILKDANTKYASMARDYNSVLDKLHDEEKQCHELLAYLQMVKKDVDEIIDNAKQPVTLPKIQKDEDEGVL